MSKFKPNQRKARKQFTKTAGTSNTHPLNLRTAPMRGGIRL